jgi:hypothetical protein
MSGASRSLQASPPTRMSPRLAEGPRRARLTGGRLSGGQLWWISGQPNNEMQLTVGAKEARPEWSSPCGEPKLSPSEHRQEAPPAADLGVRRTRSLKQEIRSPAGLDESDESNG